MESNMVGWFEIPVTDMARAKAFYEAVFEIDVQIHDLGGTKMGWFPWSEGKPGSLGGLIENKSHYTPSDSAGVLIYFSSPDVSNELSRIEGAGGKIIQPKTQISPDIGYMALFLDTEGNRLALHSRA
ncbi:VOC family protein [Flagellimonas zhangzhouensis]|uniref:VOC domain-containing protein n=1 Tax=Flagellimonas zhangzhouensis TaxID=1073328 RepID=A0A1H2RV38_9FLAO|nr:VOC family protein [Allomuricauda zhangzhouensis]SDQ68053.1 hypothetical protein SAMN05216294_2167 [Allomuricauda zhangzhouensis]SDW23346.1 hypothetical protein SAMN04487892_0815 [Allomuricauda zhangzhouensis]